MKCDVCGVEIKDKEAYTLRLGSSILRRYCSRVCFAKDGKALYDHYVKYGFIEEVS